MSLYVHAAGQKVNIIESKIAGLGFLQAIIARMANNSFYIKGWDLTLFVAVVALKKDASQYSGYLLLALIVSTIAFCLLDAYYLQQERIFRKIYNYLAESNSESINYFSINPCLLYTSDAADERSSVDLGGRRIIKKKNTNAYS